MYLNHGRCSRAVTFQNCRGHPRAKKLLEMTLLLKEITILTRNSTAKQRLPTLPIIIIIIMIFIAMLMILSYTHL